MEEDSEAVEITLLNKRDAKVYQIPPATSASGHKAGDWKEAIWRGNVRIIGKGKDLIIRLVHTGAEEGKLFAQCMIPNGEHEKYVERVTDSSRYWVLKIMNGQRHAFIGFGFSDRNDAFDFNCTLGDFKTTNDRTDEGADTTITAPLRDLSLKEGEKITLKLRGKSSETAAESAPVGGTPPLLAPPPGGGYGGAGGGFALLAPPPPPSGQQVLSSVAAAPVAAPVADFADFDGFADFQSAT